MPGAFDPWELLLHWNIFRSILILLQRSKSSCIDQIIMCSFLFGLDLWKFCCNALHCVIVHQWIHSVHFVSLQSTLHWIFDGKQIESCNFQKLIHNSRSCSIFINFQNFIRIFISCSIFRPRLLSCTSLQPEINIWLRTLHLVALWLGGVSSFVMHSGHLDMMVELHTSSFQK